jgi:hypothetical protein
MAIGSNYRTKDNVNKEQQQTKVISTKVSVDQHDRFNLLSKYLYRKGVIETPTPSALLRHSVDYVLRCHHNEMAITVLI